MTEVERLRAFIATQAREGAGRGDASCGFCDAGYKFEHYHYPGCWWVLANVLVPNEDPCERTKPGEQPKKNCTCTPCSARRWAAIARKKWPREILAQVLPPEDMP